AARVGERWAADGDWGEHCAGGSGIGPGGLGGKGGSGNGRHGAATGGNSIRVTAALCRPLPPSAARSSRHRIFLSPPHARHVDHPALAAARCAGGGGTALVG